MPITLVVLHSISLPPGEYGGDAIERLFSNRLDWDAHPYYDGIRGLQVSSHFLVRRDGAAAAVRVLRAARLARRAARRGAGARTATTTRSASSSKGSRARPFEPAQYASLARLLRALAARYPIDDVVGHEHVAPGRKFDPGAGFDWPRLRKQLRPASARHCRVRDAGASGEGPKTQHYR